MQKSSKLVVQDYGTNCKDCERYSKLGDICMIEHGKKFAWEYCRDFSPKVILPDYKELMRSVREDRALERKKQKEKKEREKRRKLKEKAEREELRKKKRRAILRKRRERLKKKALREKLKAEKKSKVISALPSIPDKTRSEKARSSLRAGKSDGNVKSRSHVDSEINNNISGERSAATPN